jgi:hypothetical protein
LRFDAHFMTRKTANVSREAISASATVKVTADAPVLSAQLTASLVATPAGSGRPSQVCDGDGCLDVTVSLLPCGHAICEKHSAVTGDVFRCPVSTCPFQVSAASVTKDSFLPFYPTLFSPSQHAKETVERLRPVCAECKADGAPHYCLEHRAALCSDCWDKVHASRIDAGHTRVPTDTADGHTCPVHKEPLEIWCATCQRLRCPKDIMDDTLCRQHRVVLVGATAPSLASDARQSVEAILQGMEEADAALLERIRDLRERRAAVARRDTSVQTQSRRLCGQLRAAVDALESALLERSDQEAHEKERLLLAADEEATAVRRVVGNVKAEASSVLRHGWSHRILDVHARLATTADSAIEATRALPEGLPTDCDVGLEANAEFAGVLARIPACIRVITLE